MVETGAGQCFATAKANPRSHACSGCGSCQQFAPCPGTTHLSACCEDRIHKCRLCVGGRTVWADSGRKSYFGAAHGVRLLRNHHQRHTAVFNLIPVAPLDGAAVLSGLLPRSMSTAFDQMQNYGFVLLIGLLYLNIPAILYTPVINFVLSFLFI